MAVNELQREYKELYQAELARRSELNKGVGLPMSLITAFSGILYFVFSRLKQPWSGLDFFQIVLIAVIVFTLLFATYHLVRSRMGYVYGFAPTPKQFESHRRDLIEFYDGDEEKSEAEVIEHVFASYRNAAHQNAENNEKRNAFLYRAMQRLVFVLPVIIILGMLQVSSQLSFGQLLNDVGVAATKKDR